LWDELARDVSAVPLYQLTGGAYVGLEDSALIRGVLASVNTHEIPHDIFDPDKLAERYPALRAEEEMIAVVEQRAGFLYVGASIRAMRARAMAGGARFDDHSPVESFDVDDTGVNVVTARGRLRADRLVVAVGAWIRELVPQLTDLLTVQRQVTVWCAALGPGVAPNEAPVTLWELPSGETFYTIPDIGDGFKLGVHYGGAFTTVAEIDRSVRAEEEHKARQLLGRYIPPAAGPVRQASVCMYTNTPDLHFLIDWLPNARDRVLIVSPCSGHGFKFASAIGESAAQLLSEGKSEFDLTPFSFRRFFN
jgi:sarcosine oxidase